VCGLANKGSGGESEKKKKKQEKRPLLQWGGAKEKKRGGGKKKEKPRYQRNKVKTRTKRETGKNREGKDQGTVQKKNVENEGASWSKARHNKRKEDVAGRIYR